MAFNRKHTINPQQWVFLAAALAIVINYAPSCDAQSAWPQWRGPTRDGKVTEGTKWPDSINEQTLKQQWRIELGPSYSGPIVSESLVFTTETVNKSHEVVRALDRKTGETKWEKKWEELIAFMDFQEHIRRLIYTTNPVEAIHRIMRKTTKSKGGWVNEKGLIKQLYLTLKYNEKSWKRKTYRWNAIQRELINTFGERYSKYLDN